MRGKIMYRGDKKLYFINGQEVTRRRFERAFPPQPLGDGSGLLGGKPKLSEALAVHPDQREEAMARDKAHGIPTDYALDGRAIITSRAHQKALVKSLGYFNKDGGFGD